MVDTIIIIIIIIIVIIIIISFMQGIYTHIPETNYVPREHGVAAILLFLFMVLISLLAVLNVLYFYLLLLLLLLLLFIVCSLMSRMRMISTMLGMMWGHFRKILDTVLLIRMEMDLQAHLSVNRSQGFFLWV